MESSNVLYLLLRCIACVAGNILRVTGTYSFMQSARQLCAIFTKL